MLSYTNSQALNYTKNFTQTQKKSCKIKIIQLLEVNNITRSKEAVGQWFAKPSQVPDFPRLTKETILLTMYNTFIMVDYHEQEQNKTQNFFSKFFNI